MSDLTSWSCSTRAYVVRIQSRAGNEITNYLPLLRRDASAASAVHSRVYGAYTAEAAASESSALSVGGCPRAWRDFGPHTVCSLTSDQKSAPKYTTQSARVVCAVLLVAYLPYGGRPVGCKSMRCKESSIDRTGSATCRGLCPRLCEYGIINRTESSISPPVQSLSQYCESNTATESLESRNAVSLHLRRRPRCPL